MKRTVLGIAIPLLSAGVFALLLVGLMRGIGPLEEELRLPGLGERPPQASVEVVIAPNRSGTLTVGPGSAADLAGIWPGFRGTGRDGISPDAHLAESWPDDGPPVLWQREVGEGHAGAAVWQGRVYLHDYDRDARADVIRCLSLEDGSDIWAYAYPVHINRNHGMSRTVPAVTGEHVVALGPMGHVTCLDAVTGELVWGLDLTGEYGARVPNWYAGQCPLIDAGRVILAVGGTDVLMMAIEVASGEVVWQIDNDRGWEMTHSSVVPVEIDGVLQYVYAASGGVMGVGVDGEVLWTTTAWTVPIANVPSPVHVGGGRLLLTGGYRRGSMLLDIVRTGQTWEARVVRQMPPGHFGSDQHTPIFHEGHIYGVRPDQQLACLTPDGEILWTSGPAHRFEIGPFTLADGKLYLMNSHSRLTMARATPEGYRPLAQVQLWRGRDSWAPMPIVDGRILLRDLTRLECRDLRGGR